MYTLVAVALVISLMITAAPPAAVAATGGTVKAEWDMVATPSMEGWVLAPQSEIVDFATAAPGAVAYAIVYAEMRPDDPAKDWHPLYLVKSDDHAATWKDFTSGVQKELDRKEFGDIAWMSHVACAPDDTNFVAVTIWPTGSTGMHVFISKDGGTTFRDSGIVEHGGVALANVFAFVVSPEVGGERELAIGGIGSDGFGAIFRGKAIGDWSTGWEMARYQGWDGTADPVVPASIAVFDIKFAPSWAADRTILAVTATPSPGGFDFHLQSGTWGTTEGWNAKSTLGIVPVLVKTVPAVPDIQGWIAGITLPHDYSGRTAAQRYSWVWINYIDATPDDGPAIGEIFRVANTAVISVTQQIHGRPWLTNVSYWGNIASGKAIAGLMGAGTFVASPEHPSAPYTSPCQGVQVYRYLTILNMDICCPAWQAACKPPTGSLGMAAFYVKEDKAYAVAQGDYWDYDEGAWSWSFDDGDTWNQLSLIDTEITNLTDVAVSPDCNKTMLVSINNAEGWDRDWLCDSVWYHAKDLSHYGFTEYNGKWQRTWSGQFGPEQYGILRLAPEETNGKTVYLVDRGTNNLYYNSMQTLACWERGTAAVDNVVDLAVKNQNTIYVLDFDGDVAMSNDYGIGGWTKAEDSGLDAGWTIAVWADEVLVGGRNGDVAHSSHGAGNFTKLEDGLQRGLVTVAFDSYYGANDTIYAAVDDFPQGGIYRWIIGESEEWFDMRAIPSTRQLTGAGNKFDANPVAFTGIVLDRPAPGNPKTSAATGGVLYASYVGELNGTLYTGVARMLTPAEDYCCDETEWDYLITAFRRYQDRFDRALFMMMPHALKICGCLTPNSYTKLFAIGFDGDRLVYDMEEGKFGTVWMFEDCYSKSGPNLRTPADGALVHTDPCECENLPFTMAWDRMCDSCNYEIEFALDRNFNQIVPVGQWDTPVPSSCIARLWHEVRPTPAVNPAVYAGGWFTPGETYYWRVRSVMAENGQTIRSWWSNERSFTVDLRATDGVYLRTPTLGAHDQPRTKVAFTWGSNTKVDSYNFVLSENADLSAPVDSKTGLKDPAYTHAGPLKWDTPYYWRVTAFKDGTAVSTAIGTFRTVAEPPKPVDPDPVTTPTWVWVLIAIGAVLVIVVIVLIFRTRRV